MTYEEVNERANVILDIIDENINKGIDIDNPDLIDGYKAAFCLAHRDIKLYCRSFKESGTSFNVDSADAIWDHFCDSLYGYKGMTSLERSLLEDAIKLINENVS